MSMLLSMKNKYRKQKGFSLLEALLAIVIIVAAGLGVVELFISADKKNKVNTTQTIVQQAASAMSQLLSTNYTSTGLDTAAVVKSGLMSNTYTTSSGGIMGPYGQVTVDQSSNTAAPSEYTVIASNIPGDQALNICQNMFTSAAVSTATKGAAGTDYAASLSDCQTSFGGASNTKIDMAFSFPREDFIANTSS